MNRKIISFTLIGVLVIALFAGCTKTEAGKVPDEGVEDGIEESSPLCEKYGIPESGIIVVQDGVNFAEGYYKVGFFVNAAGEIYLYDFSGALNPIPDENLLSKLEFVESVGTPIGKVDSKAMDELYKKMLKIDVSGEIITEPVANDAGEISLLANLNGELKELTQTGDYEGSLDSKECDEFCELFKENVASVYNDYVMNNQMREATVFAYDSEDTQIFNMHDGYFGEDIYCIIGSVEELHKFSDTYGLDLESLPWMYDLENILLGNQILFFHSDVSSGGYNLEYDRVYVIDGRISFTLSDDSYAPGPEETVTCVMDGFSHVIVLPDASLMSEYNPDTREFEVEGWDDIHDLKSGVIEENPDDSLADENV
ncbi:MAG: hypothetical protein MJ119_08010 [Lachnospiraceae bacterium]|nr:hypothetical protein [Lachnospiraceae bacterium]